MSRLLRAAAAVGTALLLSLSAIPDATAAPPPSPAAPTADLADRIRALPGVAKVAEQPAPAAGFRFFHIDFTQQVDHNARRSGTFTQRLTLLHRDESRPMVMYTSGYNVSTRASRSEPTQLVDGNQLSMEYRFFTPSRPANPDWMRQLTIKQAATDQHVIIQSFKRLYSANWLTTGGSKGGMTATYHRRFFPNDVAGSVPYVAPNDVIDREDRAYDQFLDNVGTDPACRDRLVALQRRVLGKDRRWFSDRLRTESEKNGYTYEITGSMDKALESGVIDYYYGFWQYHPQSECATLPDPNSATNEQVWESYEQISSLTWYADQSLGAFTPYYFQAAYQMGSPKPYEKRIGDLLRYPGFNTARNFVPREIRPTRFDHAAMPDVDRWVKTASHRMLYIYGGNDPWSAEPFNCGPRGERRECLRFYVAGGTHGSNIAQLPEAERERARAVVRKWAGVEDSRVLMRSATAGRVPALDDVQPDYLQPHVR